MNDKLKQLQVRAYNLYIADWLNSRNICIEDVVVENDEFQPIRGYGIFVCLEEFIDNEFQERDYMWNLLSPKDFEIWETFN